MKETVCMYLKPSKDFCEFLTTSRIIPISRNIGFHTTLGFLKLQYDFKEVETDIYSSIEKIAAQTKISQANISNIELWDHYSLLIGGEAKKNIEELHDSLNLRLNLSGIRINNTYANVNGTLFEEEFGHKPMGYTPHISIAYIGDFNSLEGVNFSYEPKIYLRAKTRGKETLEYSIDMLE